MDIDTFGQKDNFELIDWLEAENHPIYKTHYKIPVSITILDTQTKQTRIYNTTDFIDKETNTWNDYIWSDGNYACDCNRALFWNRAEPNSEQLNDDCGDERFVILSIIDLRDNSVLYSESIEDETKVCYVPKG